MGDKYPPEQWEAYAEFVSFHPSPPDICPLCGDSWETERQEDLCYCQFAKRTRVE